MITERLQDKRLKKLGINIKTKYKCLEGIRERNSDNSLLQDVTEGIILKKEYYQLGGVIHKENIFDSRMLYTYSFKMDGKKHKCPNCGFVDTISKFSEGCPYCGTHYNLDYDNKDLGSKYYYDLTMKNKSYIISTFILDFIVSFIISLVFIMETSRTFTIYDITKVLVGTLLIGSILFFLFYYMDALFILPFVRRKKEKINNLQKEFFKRMEKYNIDKKILFNNINYDLRELYYSPEYKDIIDYDILDYNSFSEEIDNDDLYINVNIEIRLVSFVDGKVVSKTSNVDYKFKRCKDISKELDGGMDIIKCRNCGASIDATTGICEYCGTKTNYLQEWYLVK